VKLYVQWESNRHCIFRGCGRALTYTELNTHAQFYSIFPHYINGTIFEDKEFI